MDLRVSKSLLLSKAKSMVSSLSGIILWSTGSPLLSPTLLNPKPFSSLQQDHILGLKTLICTEPETTHHHSHYTSRVLSRPSSPPQQPKTTPFPPEYPSHSSATMDDLIGTDSGVHMVPTGSGDDQTATGNEKRRRCCTNSRIRDKRRRHEALEHYPPAMLSAATKLQGNNYSSDRLRAPWAWTRHCRDGKLVLEGRLLARREYLEARREDGRLILNLVSIGAEDGGGDDDDDASEEMIIDQDQDCDDDEERLGGLCLESGSSYACGMFVDSILLCNAGNNNVPNSLLPALVRPMTG